MRAKNKKCTTRDERYEGLLAAYDACSLSDQIAINDLAEYMGVTDRCARDRLKEFADEFSYCNGVVIRKIRDEFYD